MRFKKELEDLLEELFGYATPNAMSKYDSIKANEIIGEHFKKLSNKVDALVKQAVSSGDENGGSKFDATELWNRAINFISPIETNGYWKALRDLHEKGVIELRELDIE